MGGFRSTLVNFQVRFHRSLLVIGTLGIAVLGERVASEPAALGYWLLLLSAVLFIPMSDVARELDEAARMLAESADADVGQARRDFASVRAPRWFQWAPIVCVVLAIAGGLVLGL